MTRTLTKADFRVGMIVRAPKLMTGLTIEVLALGEQRWFGLPRYNWGTACEGAYAYDSHRWHEVVTYPERWANVYPNGVGHFYELRVNAECSHGSERRIGILHLHPDGTTTMEAP